MPIMQWQWREEEYGTKAIALKIPEDISRTDIIVAIQEWIIGAHGERNRQIMARRLLDGVTYEALAEEFDLSDRQVKNIVYKCESKIYKHIKKG